MLCAYSSKGDAMKKILMTLAALTLLVSVNSFAGSGKGFVTFSIWQHVVENGKLVGYPLRDAGIYLDGNVPYGGPGAIGYTDADGKLTVELDAGNHTFMVGKMTSSHSLFVSETYTVSVYEGGETEFVLPVATLEANFTVHYDCGWGKALYITGATGYLGDWKTAYKLTPANGTWTFRKYLPRGLEYKIVVGPWVDGDSIDTTRVKWESGNNRTVLAGYGFHNDIWITSFQN